MLPVHLLDGIWMQGEPQFYGRFTPVDDEAGASLEEWAYWLLDWAALQMPAALPSALGIALRAEIAEMWGVALKRVPRGKPGPRERAGDQPPREHRRLAALPHRA